MQTRELWLARRCSSKAGTKLVPSWYKPTARRPRVCCMPSVQPPVHAAEVRQHRVTEQPLLLRVALLLLHTTMPSFCRLQSEPSRATGLIFLGYTRHLQPPLLQRTPAGPRPIHAEPPPRRKRHKHQHLIPPVATLQLQQQSTGATTRYQSSGYAGSQGPPAPTEGVQATPRPPPALTPGRSGSPSALSRCHKSRPCAAPCRSSSPRRVARATRKRRARQAASCPTHRHPGMP